MLHTQVSRIENNSREFTVAVDNYTDTRIEGRIYHASLKRPMQFKGLVGFVECIEGILDVHGFIREAQTRRSLIDLSDNNIMSMVKEHMKGDAEKQEPGVLKTFELTIRYRQNASWQGSISKDHGQTREFFRSFLGLARILDRELSTMAYETIDTDEKRPLHVAIDSYSDKCIEGVLSQQTMDKEIVFRSGMELVRRFNKPGQSVTPAYTAHTIIPESVLSMYRKHGEVATFSVQIRFDKHDSIQGTMLWREGRETLNFRSFLELLMCADHVLSMVENKEYEEKQQIESAI